MKMTGMQKRWLVGSMLVAVIAVAVWEYGGNRSAALAYTQQPQPANAARGRAALEPLPQLELEKLEIDKSSEPIANAFEPRSWIPPEPKVKTSPSPPQAPPLPFIYVGKMMEDGQTVVFLSKQERNYAVRSGDKIDGTYQVDKINPTTMVLTYLPLNLQQSLPIGSAN
jgi:hypothetical protein